MLAPDSENPKFGRHQPYGVISGRPVALQRRCHVWTTAAVQGKKSSGLAMWSGAVMCPASKGAVLMTAGHDEVRGSGPDQSTALTKCA